MNQATTGNSNVLQIKPCQKISKARFVPQAPDVPARKMGHRFFGTVYKIGIHNVLPHVCRLTFLTWVPPWKETQHQLHLGNLKCNKEIDCHRRAGLKMENTWLSDVLQTFNLLYPSEDGQQGKGRGRRFLTWRGSALQGAGHFSHGHSFPCTRFHTVRDGSHRRPPCSPRSPRNNLAVSDVCPL